MEEILAIDEISQSAEKKVPMELSVEGLMMESAMNSLGVSSDKSEEAKQELQEYIAIMLEKEKEDAFEAVRYAIYKVVPQVMTYREAVLEETADRFNIVNELNNDMLDMQGKFAAAGDTTLINGNSQMLGVENAVAYFEKAGMNAEKVKLMIEEGHLPEGIGNTILKNLDEITASTYEPHSISGTTTDPRNYKYGQSVGLANGVAGLDTVSTFTDGSYFSRSMTPAHQDGWNDNRTWAYGEDAATAPYANQLNDNNAVIQMTLNGYSKQEEALFKNRIEEYGQYLSLSSQLYDSGVKGVQVHVRDQRV